MLCLLKRSMCSHGLFSLELIKSLSLCASFFAASEISLVGKRGQSENVCVKQFMLKKNQPTTTTLRPTFITVLG